VARPDESYCYYFGVEGCLTTFQYLENIHDYTYNWVNSDNGKYVEDAIMVQTFYIGRILSNSHLHLGTVVPSYGMVYYDNIEELWYYSNNSYQVLTCDPTPEVILYDCSKLNLILVSRNSFVPLFVSPSISLSLGPSIPQSP